MIFYLLRHGQTDWDAAGRVLGWKDMPLNQAGISEAQTAAQKLLSLGISTVYASDLKRTKKTADIISGRLDLPVHYTKRLREMNFGKAEGVKKTDLDAKFSYVYQSFNDLTNPERYDIKYPNGETIGEVQQRFMKFADRLIKNKEDNVLIVTHGMLIRIFAESCLKKTICLNAGSVLRVTYDEKSKKFRSPKVIF